MIGRPTEIRAKLDCMDNFTIMDRSVRPNEEHIEASTLISCMAAEGKISTIQNAKGDTPLLLSYAVISGTLPTKCSGGGLSDGC